MVFVKLTFILLFLCGFLVNSEQINESEYYAPHISAVLKYLNSKPNKAFDYKKGVFVNAHQKADIVELTVDVDVTCMPNTQYIGVPCTEHQQICTAFVQQNENENDYRVLSDVSCKLKGDSSTEKEAESVDELTTILPHSQQESKIELSNEAVSSEQNADFVAVKVDRVPCLGCPFDLNTNVEGVTELVDSALRHVETERDRKHTLVKVIRLQQQVVAGVKYILLIEIAPTICQKDIDLSSTNCPVDERAGASACEVVFLQRLWLSKSKSIIRNNCTVSQEYTAGGENHGERNDRNEINNINNAGEISPKGLSDLESQILSIDDTNSKPATKINHEYNTESITANIQESTKNQYNFQDSLTSRDCYRPSYYFNRPRPAQVLPEIISVKSVNENEAADTLQTDTTRQSDLYYAHRRNSISNSDVSSRNDEDVALNKVKRSLSQVVETSESEDRYHPPALIGGHTSIPLNDSRILQFTEDTLTKLDGLSEHPNKNKVVEIISATSQVVAGALYRIKVKISLSKCLKNDPTPSEDCEFMQNAKIKLCSIKAWDRPWLNETEITVKCDDNDTEYTFDTSPRNKRSAEPETQHREAIIVGVSKHIFPGLSDSENEANPKVLEYVKTGLEYLNSQSVDKIKYNIKKVTKVSNQIVAGRLWQITALLSKDLEDSEHKVCHFKVWEQPWLTTPLKINIICENDTNFYSFVPRMHQNFNHPNANTLDKFKDFMLKHNKTYLNEVEFNYRLKVFKDNLNTIKLLNKYEQGTATYGITQFADLTSNEFSKSHGLRLDLRQHIENYLPPMNAIIPDIELPTEFDWRQKAAVTEVKNQGSCGSCWAFSTIGNIEGQYAIKYGKLVEFSEQELVDCDKLDQGCNGGLMDNAYRFIEETGGLETESDYPYEGDDEKCHFNRTDVRVQINGALNISHNETNMAKWLVQNGPISIAINANAMQFYFGGVSHPWKILCNPKSLDHGVLIVGYGVDKYPLFNKTLPYWIIKNSWGSSWGEQGYYRVYRGDGTCGLNKTPSSSIVA